MTLDTIKSKKHIFLPLGNLAVEFIILGFMEVFHVLERETAEPLLECALLPRHCAHHTLIIAQYHLRFFKLVLRKKPPAVLPASGTYGD